MRYEHTPRPLIEEHHHIRDLIERQEKRSDDRTYYREKAKTAGEREELITDAKSQTLTDFYCEHCRLDFRGIAVKQIEIDWTCPTQRIAFYKTKCWKGHWVIRLITDRHRDGFWSKSKRMAKDKGEYALDTIQPYQTNFNLLYGKK